jgi:hypothetical protein
MDRLVQDFQPYLGLSLVQEALREIAIKFASSDAIGSIRAANELHRLLGGDLDIHRTDTHMQVCALLDALGVAGS